LETLLSETDIVPAVNQIELNPYFSQRQLREVHQRHGIMTEAWPPIGGDYARKPDLLPGDANTPLKHPVVTGLGDKYGKTPAQIVLRWHLSMVS
jgi:2,5-diketo-D-gluconate reductase A